MSSSLDNNNSNNNNNNKIQKILTTTTTTTNTKRKDFKLLFNNNNNNNNNSKQQLLEQESLSKNITDIMDAADTLISLAHSNSPTENKQTIELMLSQPFEIKTKQQQDQVKNDESAKQTSKNIIVSPHVQMIKQVIKSFNTSDNLVSTKNTKRIDSISSLSNLESESQNSDSNIEQLSSSNNKNNKRVSDDNYDDDYDIDDNDCTLSNAKRTKNHLIKIKYGPLQVQQRLKAAPTLATGRRSKDVPLPPEEEKKRQERRMRNKKAAAKCRHKREEVAKKLEQQAAELTIKHDKILNEMKKLAEKKEELLKLLKIHDKKCKNSNKEASPLKSSSIIFSTNILTDKKLNDNFIDQKIDDDNETDLKKTNPMISGNSIKNPQNELSEYVKFERPKDLSLMILNRQDSTTQALFNLCKTPTPTSGAPTTLTSTNFLNISSSLNSTYSPTLNTPTNYLITQMDNFSPSTPTNSSRLFSILKS